MHFSVLFRILNSETKYYDELNNAADCDMRLFWQLVNKKKKRRTGLITEISLDETSFRDPYDISNAFKTHYSRGLVRKITMTLIIPILRQ